jgi:DNA-directed RNA polymerase specialized sigma24 family protein
VERPDTSILTNLASDTTRDFDALFRAYYRRLARLLYRVTGETTRAEEIAAEAFWRLHKTTPASNSNLEGWLYRTGVRLALDTLKRIADARATKASLRYLALSALRTRCSRNRKSRAACGQHWQPSSRTRRR